MTDTFTPPIDDDTYKAHEYITAEPTPGSKPVPGYGHGNQKAYDAALRRLEKQAREWEAEAAEAQGQISWIDGEIERLQRERSLAVSRNANSLKVAKGLRERLPKEEGA